MHWSDKRFLISILINSPQIQRWYRVTHLQGFDKLHSLFFIYIQRRSACLCLQPESHATTRSHLSEKTGHSNNYRGIQSSDISPDIWFGISGQLHITQSTIPTLHVYTWKFCLYLHQKWAPLYDSLKVGEYYNCRAHNINTAVLFHNRGPPRPLAQ